MPSKDTIPFNGYCLERYPILLPSCISPQQLPAPLSIAPLTNDGAVHQIPEADLPHEPGAPPSPHAVGGVTVPQNLYRHPSKRGSTRYGRPMNPHSDTVTFQSTRLTGSGDIEIILGVSAEEALAGYSSRSNSSALVDAKTLVLQDQGVNITLHVLVCPKNMLSPMASIHFCTPFCTILVL